MFFLLALPTLAEIIFTTAATTIAAKAASDLYDSATRKDDE